MASNSRFESPPKLLTSMTIESEGENGTNARSESLGSRRYFSISLMMSSGAGMGDIVRNPYVSQSTDPYSGLQIGSSYGFVVNAHAHDTSIIWY
jgi:hypothetical protein